jgi:cytosine/adenosine deaminase-related metal-dependent hydrolase
VLLDMDDPSLQPPFRYEKNVVYSMTPHAIREVLVAGRTVFRDGEIANVSWQTVLDGLRAVTDRWPG